MPWDRRVPNEYRGPLASIGLTYPGVNPSHRPDLYAVWMPRYRHGKVQGVEQDFMGWYSPGGETFYDRDDVATAGAECRAMWCPLHEAAAPGAKLPDMVWLRNETETVIRGTESGWWVRDPHGMVPRLRKLMADSGFVLLGEDGYLVAGYSVRPGEDDCFFALRMHVIGASVARHSQVVVLPSNWQTPLWPERVVAAMRNLARSANSATQ